ncbi:MAG: TlpA family protein disulfide reductase [Campylobacteraceae bacterium]|jgi:peroxiredoxin|nr:TlpA family protein disulfide reductase [Campylobacteraceae bacterium]
MIKKIIFAAFFILSTLFAQTDGGVKNNEKAPEISAKDLEGKSVKLDEFKNKVIVIRFWEKGCHHCMMEMPKLQELQNEYSEDLAVIGINSDNSIEDMKAFQDEYKITFTLLKDDLDITKKRYGVVVVPTMFIIDKNGTVKYKIFGMSSWEKSREKILEVL